MPRRLIFTPFLCGGAVFFIAKGKNHMDFVYLAVAIAFFALSWKFVDVCERL